MNKQTMMWISNLGTTFKITGFTSGLKHVAREHKEKFEYLKNTETIDKWQREIKLITKTQICVYRQVF